MNIESSEQLKDLVESAKKLRSAILFFIQRFPGKLNRVMLCKYLFYADGHYYQKFQETITEFPYLHIEGSPQPLHFNELIHSMLCEGAIEVQPQITEEERDGKKFTVLRGMSFNTAGHEKGTFSRRELKVLNSVASLLDGSLALETRYFPNLFQSYAQTNLYSQIKFHAFESGVRPHLSWKAWASKIFRFRQQ